MAKIYTSGSVKYISEVCFFEDGVHGCGAQVCRCVCVDVSVCLGEQAGVIASRGPRDSLSLSCARALSVSLSCAAGGAAGCVLSFKVTAHGLRRLCHDVIAAPTTGPELEVLNVHAQGCGVWLHLRVRELVAVLQVPILRVGLHVSKPVVSRVADGRGVGVYLCIFQVITVCKPPHTVFVARVPELVKLGVGAGCDVGAHRSVYACACHVGKVRYRTALPPPPTH